MKPLLLWGSKSLSGIVVELFMEGEYYSDLCALIVYSVQVLVGGGRGEG